ncbi:hypothetical protein COLO4_24658 [Corchorus olitorius]|uniref:Uncharacterized protein n=1 Tax=Corchorus olitorius TaxID=93759 RepID=A0A1R3I894_9ROSI|nr:hypothetical protein COLO4_24658 [Corchorus olitorius]
MSTVLSSSSSGKDVINSKETPALPTKTTNLPGVAKEYQHLSPTPLVVAK